MLHNFTAGNKFRCPKQKQFEQSEFSGSQRDRLFVARGAPAVAVECEVGVAKPCVAAMKAPAKQRPQYSRTPRCSAGRVASSRILARFRATSLFRGLRIPVP